MTSLAAAAKIHGRCPVDFTMGIFFRVHHGEIHGDITGEFCEIQG